MDMMATGVRTPVGIRIVAPDPTRLDAIGDGGARARRGARGTRSAIFESLGGETWPDARRRSGGAGALPRRSRRGALDRRVCSPPADRSARSTKTADGCGCGSRPSPRPPPAWPRRPAPRGHGSRSGPPGTSAGQPVPLGLVGRPVYVRRPAALRTEHGELCAYVYVDLPAGRRSAGLRRSRARRDVAAAISSGELQLAPGERVEWTGQYELLVSGTTDGFTGSSRSSRSRCSGLLFLQFRNLTEALIVLVSVPFALVGSFWTLFLLGYPAVGAGLGRPPVGGGPGDADGRGDGRLHRRGVSPARARRPDPHPRRHRRGARRRDRAAPPPEDHDHHDDGGQPAPAALGGRSAAPTS